ncbi:Leukotriene A-4 hydrolase [Hondaea fermentalgiana]|uniref:Leukotriene A-4 hydrolase n=1 Tax=Hondaea fermentalgiana TaxID=2315210 RepID=A0A2R5H396_9STRA|nr:Leukotriene A-4 hydrolase [Hondaea fermentalgiana]|eukprot:GBG34884.1 Leukotriene A-4 hydrolase [Hondaea fermentalgiana]
MASLKQRAGWNRLKDSVALFGPEHDFTKLHVPLEDADPDDAFSMVPYEKGAAFLLYLESLVGGPTYFERFLKAYVLRFQYGTVSWEQFRSFFTEYFREHKIAATTLDSIDWDKWVHGTGMPDWEPPLDSSLIDAVAQAAAHWIENRSAPSWASKRLSNWSADQLIAFVEELLNADADLITGELIDAVDEWYNFSSTRNSEILFRWCLLCLRARDERRFGMVVRFLLEQGRMKFVRPLYRELFQAGPKGRATAIETFQENRAGYHAIAAKMIARDLGLEE